MAGKALRDAKYKFDCAHTSLLTRAKKTLETILGVSDQLNIPVYETWRLNERHYGGLTGLNKSETAVKYGEAQVCRDFDIYIFHVIELYELGYCEDLFLMFSLQFQFCIENSYFFNYNSGQNMEKKL